jgi:hypothetical protein
MTKTVIFEYDTNILSCFKYVIEQAELDVFIGSLVSSEEFGDVDLHFLQNFVKIDVR